MQTVRILLRASCLTNDIPKPTQFLLKSLLPVQAWILHTMIKGTLSAAVSASIGFMLAEAFAVIAK